MSNRRIEPVWLAYSLLDDLILIYPVYAIMILAAGISAVQLSLLFVIWSLSSLLFEVPSGVLSDLVNRKRYLGAGALIRAAGFVTWLVFPSFSGYAAGFVLWSAGGAMSSGTLEALLHDVLTEQKRPADFARIYGRGRAMGGLGVFLAMALGGYAAESGFAWPLLLSAAAPVVAVLLLLVLIEEPPRSHPAAEADLATTLEAATRALLRDRRLLLICAMLMLLTGVAGVMDEFVGPVLAETGRFDLAAIGVLYGTILGAQAVGAAFAHRFTRVGFRRLAVLGAVAHGLLLTACLSGGISLVVLAAGYFLMMGAIAVLLESALQRQIESHARATISSIAGAGREAWGIALFLIIGFLAERSQWSSALALVAGAIAGVVLLIAVAGRQLPVAARSRS